MSVKNSGDCFFLTKQKQIVEMKYAFLLNGEYYVCGDVFTHKKSFFNDPFDSSYIDIYETYAAHISKSIELNASFND